MSPSSTQLPQFGQIPIIITSLLIIQIRILKDVFSHSNKEVHWNILKTSHCRMFIIIGIICSKNDMWFITIIITNIRLDKFPFISMELSNFNNKLSIFYKQYNIYFSVKTFPKRNNIKYLGIYN